MPGPHAIARHCSMLYFTALHCDTVSSVYCGAVQFSALHCSSAVGFNVMQCGEVSLCALQHSIVKISALHSTTLLHYTTLHCTTLHCTALHYTSLHYSMTHLLHITSALHSSSTPGHKHTTSLQSACRNRHFTVHCSLCTTHHAMHCSLCSTHTVHCALCTKHYVMHYVLHLAQPLYNVIYWTMS